MTLEPYKDIYAEAISRIVIRNLLEINTADYDQQEMEDFAKGFTARDVRRMNTERHTLVVTDHGQLLGTGSIDEVKGSKDYMVWTMFVHPDYQRRGIGAMIMSGLESLAIELGCHRLIVPSSITARSFYESLNYVYSAGMPVLGDEKLYKMEKILQ